MQLGCSSRVALPLEVPFEYLRSFIMKNVDRIQKYNFFGISYVPVKVPLSENTLHPNVQRKRETPVSYILISLYSDAFDK